MSKKELDYSLDPSVLGRVKWELDNYYINAEKAREVIPDEMYESYPSVHYGTDPVAYTSTPSRRTERIVDGIIEQKAKIKDARDSVKGIDKGILRASRTVKTKGEVKAMEKDLREHLIDKIPNKPYIPEFVPHTGRNRRISRRPDTLRKYKKRAFYFIAVELNLIEASEEILREELRKKRRRSREQKD